MPSEFEKIANIIDATRTAVDIGVFGAGVVMHVNNIIDNDDLVYALIPPAAMETLSAAYTIVHAIVALCNSEERKKVVKNYVFYTRLFGAAVSSLAAVGMGNYAVDQILQADHTSTNESEHTNVSELLAIAGVFAAAGSLALNRAVAAGGPQRNNPRNNPEDEKPLDQNEGMPLVP